MLRAPAKKGSGAGGVAVGDRAPEVIGRRANVGAARVTRRDELRTRRGDPRNEDLRQNADHQTRNRSYPPPRVPPFIIHPSSFVSPYPLFQNVPP